MLSFIEMKTEGYCGGAGAGQQVAVWESLCFVYLEHKRQQASKARSGRAAGRTPTVFASRRGLPCRYAHLTNQRSFCLKTSPPALMTVKRTF